MAKRKKKTKQKSALNRVGSMKNFESWMLKRMSKGHGSKKNQKDHKKRGPTKGGVQE